MIFLVYNVVFVRITGSYIMYSHWLIFIVACILWMPFYTPALVLCLTTLCYDIYYFLHIASTISCLEKKSTDGSNYSERN